MNKKQIIKKTEEFVKKNMKGDSGHDWHHINRVRNLALHIAKKEKADLFIVELGALLHDIGDWKFHNKDEHAGSKITKELLSRFKVDIKLINVFCDMVDKVSFKGAGVKSEMKTLEGKIVQDADKLDALGAIGIARTFSYGGHFNVPIWNPDRKPVLHKSFAAYKKNNSDTINHFYEKLLLLKDRMHTKTAKQLAIPRHKFMEKYLEQFYKEWDIQ